MLKRTSNALSPLLKEESFLDVTSDIFEDIRLDADFMDEQDLLAEPFAPNSNTGIQIQPTLQISHSAVDGDIFGKDILESDIFYSNNFDSNVFYNYDLGNYFDFNNNANNNNASNNNANNNNASNNNANNNNASNNNANNNNASNNNAHNNNASNNNAQNMNDNKISFTLPSDPALKKAAQQGKAYALSGGKLRTEGELIEKNEYSLEQAKTYLAYYQAYRGSNEIQQIRHATHMGYSAASSKCRQATPEALKKKYKDITEGEITAYTQGYLDYKSRHPTENNKRHRTHNLEEKNGLSCKSDTSTDHSDSIGNNKFS